MKKTYAGLDRSYADMKMEAAVLRFLGEMMRANEPNIALRESFELTIAEFPGFEVPLRGLHKSVIKEGEATSVGFESQREYFTNFVPGLMQFDDNNLGQISTLLLNAAHLIDRMAKMANSDAGPISDQKIYEVVFYRLLDLLLSAGYHKFGTIRLACRTYLSERASAKIFESIRDGRLLSEQMKRHPKHFSRRDWYFMGLAEKNSEMPRLCRQLADIKEAALFNGRREERLEEMMEFLFLDWNMRLGIPFVKILGLLGNLSKVRSRKKVWKDMYQEIMSGSTISQSMSKHKKMFSPYMVAMVKAGELNGMLEHTFGRIVNHLKQKYWGIEAPIPGLIGHS